MIELPLYEIRIEALLVQYISNQTAHAVNSHFVAQPVKGLPKRIFSQMTLFTGASEYIAVRPVICHLLKLPLLLFIRDAGTVHTSRSKSISLHLAARME